MNDADLPRHSAVATDDFAVGERVAETTTKDETSVIELTLITPWGTPLARRRVVADTRQDVAVPITISRNCFNIDCGEQSCLDGECVDPTCSSGKEPSCMRVGCTEDSECSTELLCSVARCSPDGACLQVASDELCAAGEVCHPLQGCQRPPSSQDAGPPDAGRPDTPEVPDTGPVDTGPVDTGPVDTGPIDTGPIDTGPIDTGPVDTGPPVVPHWERVATPTSITPRYYSRGAYNYNEGAGYLYGGRDPMDSSLADLWRYQDGDWSLVCNPCDPGTRHTLMAYHGGRNALLLFRRPQMSLEDGYAEIWEYRNAAWTRYTAVGEPSGNSGEAYVEYDRARDVIVMTLGESNDEDPTEYRFDDGMNTYVATQIDVPNDGPPNRETSPDGAITYAAGVGVVVHGGRLGGSPSMASDDMWAWNGTVWTEICTNCTGNPRQEHSFAYDPVHEDYIVVAGKHRLGFDLLGTWAYPTTGTSQLTDTPTPTWGAVIFYDERNQEMILTTGYGLMSTAITTVAQPRTD